MIDLKILGRRLRLLRKRMGLTQSELAGTLNVSQTAISRLENGDEVYASVLLAVLGYFQDTYSLDYLIIDNFDADSARLQHRSLDDIRQQLERLVHLI
ncbi:MAG: helix-turn-helix transcriptional regulator [Prevotella sp.]|nr:helix-turn-helix transcriptional regulator [Prevotella sp.]